MEPTGLQNALRCLDGLLRSALHHGQTHLAWEDLRSLCEDAVVAAGLGDWEISPLAAYAIVADRGMQLAGYVAPRRSRTQGASAPMFAILDLLQHLTAVLGPTGDARTYRETA
jgi:hypothetical protein